MSELKTNYSTLKLVRRSALQAGVLEVVLNRPDVRNAFNDVMIQDLIDVFSKEAMHEEVRVVIIRGSGKAFCAGGDLNWMKKSVDFSYDENLQDTMKLSGLFNQLNEFPKPIIGRLHGAAIGGGVGLVSICDIAIAEENTQFSLSEVMLGLVPACIGPFVISKIGPSNARRFFISGERFKAKQARKIGLVHLLAEGDKELDRVLDETVTRILQCSPNAVSVAKNMVLNLAWPEKRAKVDNCIEMISKTLAEIRVSPEGQEGVRAFLEKRKPNWISE